MRSKKNREVNIFSASVVDLFASGLGVFLIVAIIALVNQKKENSKVVTESPAPSIELSELEKQNADLKNQISKLEQQGVSSKMEMVSKFAVESDKIQKKTLANENLIAINKELSETIVKLKDQNKRLDKEVKELKLSGKIEGVPNLISSNLAIGTKIQLPNVQFYAGTDKPIQPYALLEIKNLAKRLNENPSVKVEVSGHIFLSEKEIKSRETYDKSNLSGRRAQLVCDELVNLGVARNRLKCIGYGGQRYLYLTNDQYSEEAQLNRRVEVEVIAD